MRTAAAGSMAEATGRNRRRIPVLGRATGGSDDAQAPTRGCPAARAVDRTAGRGACGLLLLLLAARLRHRGRRAVPSPCVLLPAGTGRVRPAPAAHRLRGLLSALLPPLVR